MSQTPYDIDDAPEDYFSDSDQSPYDAQPETTEDWTDEQILEYGTDDD